MSDQPTLNNTSATAVRSKFFYGWVIVVVCALRLAITYGLMYSYSVFFKPLSDYFSWDRATVSLVYSASLIIRGAISIATGWLADKYGARKLMVFCGFMIGLGLVLSSQVHTLWQFFTTYALVEAIGLSGAFGIGTAIVARWFTANRGLALGIVACGSGLGTLLIVPGNESLINSLGWSHAFIICGIATGLIMIVSALFLNPAPRFHPSGLQNSTASVPVSDVIPGTQDGMPLRQSVKDYRLLILMLAFLFFFLGIQIIMVHLVNYATDLGINPLVAAGLISIIGATSIAGRLSMGVGAERYGIHNTLILTRILLIVSFVFIIFVRSLWSFYLFAALFGLPYGGEIPQIPLYIGKYFGTGAMATLVGLSTFVMNIGGGVGSWAAGKIFDSTGAYQWAFIGGALSGLSSLILIIILQKINSRSNTSLSS